jgi:hypothetical protein
VSKHDLPGDIEQEEHDNHIMKNNALRCEYQYKKKQKNKKAQRWGAIIEVKKIKSKIK